MVVTHKQMVFESTLFTKASKWLVEYALDHFATIDEGAITFLQQFWVEKMVP